MNPFIMNPEGVEPPVRRGQTGGRPLPLSTTSRSMESRLGTNPLHPKAVSSPAVRISGDRERLGTHKGISLWPPPTG